MLNHGVRHTASGSFTGSASRSSTCRAPITVSCDGDSLTFGPEAPYERNGDVGKVAFPCGYPLAVAADGDGINLYYGAADTCIGLATGEPARAPSVARRPPARLRETMAGGPPTET
jgi:predicted GH43/DUF377 family glycosyl hydrolase